MTAAESIALAGKMWLYEDDTRTWLANDPIAHVDTIEATKYELLRNTAQCALRNFGNLVDGPDRHRAGSTIGGSGPR